MPRILTFITVSGPIDVFGVIRCRSKYRAVAGDATQGVYIYRPSGMAHGSNTDSATVAWYAYILLDSTEHIFFLGRILYMFDVFV